MIAYPRTRASLLILVVAGLFSSSTLGTFAQRKQRPTKGTSFSAQEIARRALPAVVLLVCDDGKTSSQGSGFFIRPGVLVTNYHIIEGMGRGIVRRAVGSRRERRDFRVRRVIAYEKDADLALLSVPGARDAGVPALPLTPEGKLTEVGETVYALGNPEGLVGTISPGIIAAKLRGSQDQARLQITTPISHGSSGGPIVNTRGEVVGIAEGSLSEGQNLNFAVPASLIHRILHRTGPGEYAEDLDYINNSSPLEDGWIWPDKAEPKEIDLTPGLVPESKEVEPTLEETTSWPTQKLEGLSATTETNSRPDSDNRIEHYQVKPAGADGTARVTVWESRKSPGLSNEACAVASRAGFFVFSHCII